MKKTLIFGLILICLLFVSGCTLFCSESCSDANPCTEDICKLMGCVHNKLDGKQTGCYSSACYNRQCVEGFCKISEIDNYCGNNRCETGENYSNCPADCEISENDCRIFKKEKNSFIYKDYNPKCKDIQLRACKNLEVRNCDKFWTGEMNIIECKKYGFYDSNVDSSSKGICFLNMATKYRDEDICNYISNIGDYDKYWYCMARLRYGKSACSHIDSNYWLDQCLKDTI